MSMSARQYNQLLIINGELSLCAQLQLLNLLLQGLDLLIQLLNLVRMGFFQLRDFLSVNFLQLCDFDRVVFQKLQDLALQELARFIKASLSLLAFAFEVCLLKIEGFLELPAGNCCVLLHLLTLFIVTVDELVTAEWRWSRSSDRWSSSWSHSSQQRSCVSQR
ncbi:hypothetical protein FGO68_gene8476 [Halteria grandinella]|uniref:Uncharacterized protein n=1 Tax=Halteria grandinella TaxID=5974 RepID=A0A8J8NPE6_HALGN|nr:hypothetical protein FGO68_gene8476 [Halteria grandinella]